MFMGTWAPCFFTDSLGSLGLAFLHICFLGDSNISVCVTGQVHQGGRGPESGEWQSCSVVSANHCHGR